MFYTAVRNNTVGAATTGTGTDDNIASRRDERIQEITPSSVRKPACRHTHTHSSARCRHHKHHMATTHSTSEGQTWPPPTPDTPPRRQPRLQELHHVLH